MKIIPSDTATKGACSVYARATGAAESVPMFNALQEAYDRDEALLTAARVDAAVRAVQEWITVASRHREKPVTAADVAHSSLLRRLLSGKSALPFPPPRRFAYPDYELAEGARVQVSEVHGPYPNQAPAMLVVDQSLWQIVEARDVELDATAPGHGGRTWRSGSAVLSWPEELGSRFVLARDPALQHGYGWLQRAAAP